MMGTLSEADLAVLMEDMRWPDSLTSDNVAARVTLFGIEFTANTVCVVCALLFLRVCAQTRALHPNLRAVLCNSALTGAIMCTARQMLITNMVPGLHFMAKYDRLYTIVVNVHDSAFFLEIEVLMVNTIERIFSTYYATSYESSHSYVSVLIIFVVPWFFAMCQGAFLYADSARLYTSFGISLVIFVLASVGNWWLTRTNRRRFLRISGTLSERYQIAENVRSLDTNRLLVKLCSAQYISVMFVGFFNIWFYTQIHSINVLHSLTTCVDILMAVFATLRILVTVYTHAEMRRRWRAVFTGIRSPLRRLFCCCCGCCGAATSRVSNEPGAGGTGGNIVRGLVTGQVLNRDISIEDYFRMLNQSWQDCNSFVKNG